MGNLGALEETILLIALVLDDAAYGVNVTEEYQKRMGKAITLPAVHTVLRRLENKGLLKSKMGGATAVRGGRRKRFYKVTYSGNQALVEARKTRESLWLLVPKLDSAW